MSDDISPDQYGRFDIWRSAYGGSVYNASEDKRPYFVQTYSGSQYGWEDVYRSDDLYDAQDRLTEYRLNQPGLKHRLVRKTVTDDSKEVES